MSLPDNDELNKRVEMEKAVQSISKLISSQVNRASPEYTRAVKNLSNATRQLSRMNLDSKTLEHLQQIHFMTENITKITSLNLEALKSLDYFQGIGTQLQQMKALHKDYFKSVRPLVEAAAVLKNNHGFLSMITKTSLTPTVEDQIIDNVTTNWPNSSLQASKNEEDPDLILTNNSEPDIERSISEMTNIMGLTSILDVGHLELISFLNHISEYAYLAHKAEGGISEKIFTAVKKWANTMQVNETVYRARKHAEGQEDPYLVRDMYGPPYGIAGHSRFNRIGEKALYTCSDKDTALKEIRTQFDDVGTIYEFEIDEELLVLDMTDDKHVLFELCMRPAKLSSGSKIINEYVLPNFVAECCRYQGIKAIRYRSVQDDEAINHVFFHLPEDSLLNRRVGIYKATEHGIDYKFSLNLE